jgi:prepilin peptidase CpaA
MASTRGLVALILGRFFLILTIYAAVSDLRTVTIPNRISLLLVAAFIPVAVMGGLSAFDILLHFASGTSCWPSPSGSLRWHGSGVETPNRQPPWRFGSDSEKPSSTCSSRPSQGGPDCGAPDPSLRPVPAFAMSWTWLDRLHDCESGVRYGVALAAAAVMVDPNSPLWQAAS